MAGSFAFIDLAAQQQRIRAKIDAAIAGVLDRGAYIMGPEVFELEKRLSAFTGARHTISCANGTDALALALMAWSIKPGDAVFCPSFTFAATAEVVAWLGATPVFVDILPDTFNMDPASLEKAIAETRAAGKLTPRVVIAVDLFGQMADYASIKPICDQHGLKLIADAAQGFGATTNGETASVYADVVSTSFFPAKPLGCYGDGGALQTNDDELTEVIKSLRVHGQGSDKYDNVRIGMNGRLDTVQAAVLLEKLAIFPDEIAARNEVARRYSTALADLVETPFVPEGYVSTWAQYTIKLATGQRDAFQESLKAEGIPTAVYYPKPLHLQTAYRQFPVQGNGLPNSEDASGRVISLPMHPYLTEEDQDRVIRAVKGALAVGETNR